MSCGLGAQVFNMMMREPGQWPGIRPLEPGDKSNRLVTANEPRLPSGAPVKVRRASDQCRQAAQRWALGELRRLHHPRSVWDRPCGTTMRRARGL